MVDQLVRALDESKLAKDTIVIFTGDNGTHRKIESRLAGRVIKGGKNKTIDAGTHVPLIANWPRAMPSAKVCEDLVDFSDFLPTLTEAAGTTLSNDYEIDGRSFLPQLRGKPGYPRSWIFCHFQKKGKKKEEAQVFVRNKRWKQPVVYTRTGGRMVVEDTWRR